MFLSALKFLTVLQTTIVPSLPAGSNQDIQSLYSEILGEMSAGRFTNAEALAKFLPKEKITISWDDSGVVNEYRPVFVESRDRAIQEWTQFMSNYSIKQGSQPDIKFSFVPVLKPVAGEKTPPAAVHFYDVTPGKPRLEVVIALQRGEEKSATQGTDVHNEVAYALASYYGLAETPQFGGYSTRTEGPANLLVKPLPSEFLIAKTIVEVSNRTRSAIKLKEKWRYEKPQATIDQLTFDLGTVNQGEVRQITPLISNVGKGAMRVRMVPDCGCIILSNFSALKGNESRRVPIKIDTIDNVGELHRSVMVYTNDPEKPVIELKIRVNVRPAYRFLMPEGEVAVIDITGGKKEVYLSLSDGVDFKPLNYRFDGIQNDVTVEPWQGTMADPFLNEREKPRRGYKFTIQVKAGYFTGRLFGTLIVTTDHPSFPILRAGIGIQSGIVAMPDRIYLGQIVKAPRLAHFLVSRPGKPFKILKIESDSAYLTFRQIATREDWEYKVFVQYDGKSPIPAINTIIKITTDDPRQTVISVPYQAMIK